MRSFLLPLLSILFFNGSSYHPASIPDTLVFCGIEITLTEGVKTKIREIKKKLNENPVYFNAAIERADTYLPFIEEALVDIGIPNDMKYVAMQESNLFAAATSKSNAVGFWQFKEDAAKESGLKVDEWIDERKHIYRSSVAAASYLARANRDFDNWAYSIISYYEGVTGAVAYSDPQYYGQKKMTIDENAHWYLIKTIAYKLSYEEALKLTMQPKTWLQPVAIKGVKNTAELATRLNVTEDKILEWNRWILKKELPLEDNLTVYIPHVGELYSNHIPDPNKFQVIAKIKAHTPTKPQPVEPTPPKVTPPVVTTSPPTTPAPEVAPPAPAPEASNEVTPFGLSGGAISPKSLPAEAYIEIELVDDFYYGASASKNGFSPEYILYDGSKKLQDICLELGYSYADLLYWNGLNINTEPTLGAIIYLKKPAKSRFHIVTAGETLGEIARIHNTSISKIQKKNRMGETEYTLYIGQKLYLKDSRPKNEKWVILTHPLIKVSATLPSPPKVTRSEATPAGIAMLPAPMLTSPPTEPAHAKVEEAITAKNADVSLEKRTEPTPIETMPIFAPITESPLTPKWIEHKTVEGETLWGISQKYKTKVEIIKKVNKLSTESLPPGVVLKIFTTFPSADENGYHYHKVLGGEVIEKIAFRYGVTVEEIIKDNELSSPILKPSQVLKLRTKK